MCCVAKVGAGIAGVSEVRPRWERREPIQKGEGGSLGCGGSSWSAGRRGRCLSALRQGPLFASVCAVPHSEPGLQLQRSDLAWALVLWKWTLL